MIQKTVYSCLLSLSLIGSFAYCQQTAPQITDSIKEFKYRAKFRNTSGWKTDETILLRSMSEPWSAQKSQIKCAIQYFPTDSIINVISNPTSKHEVLKDLQNLHSDTSGFFDNSTHFFIHPFRKNQYIYTEIAPFPSKEYKYLAVGTEWSSKTYILFGWGAFKGKSKETYKVVACEDCEFAGESLERCWRIEAVGIHNKVGKNTLNFIFHEKYGFLDMRYTFYDGSEIQFELTEVIKVK